MDPAADQKSQSPPKRKGGRPRKITLAALQEQNAALQQELHALRAMVVAGQGQAQPQDASASPAPQPAAASAPSTPTAASPPRPGSPYQQEDSEDLEEGFGLSIESAGGLLSVSFPLDDDVSEPGKKFPSAQFKDLLAGLNAAALQIPPSFGAAERLPVLLRFLRKYAAALESVGIYNIGRANFALRLLDDKALGALDLRDVEPDQLHDELISRTNDLCQTTDTSALLAVFFALARKKGETTLALWDRCYKEANVLLLLGLLTEKQLCTHLCGPAVLGKDVPGFVLLAVERVKDQHLFTYKELRKAWVTFGADQEVAMTTPKGHSASVGGRESKILLPHQSKPQQQEHQRQRSSPAMDHSQPCKSKNCSEPDGPAHAWWSCASFVCHKCKKAGPGHDARNCPDARKPVFEPAKGF
jgi:hypothetical protein